MTHGTAAAVSCSCKESSIEAMPSSVFAHDFTIAEWSARSVANDRLAFETSIPMLETSDVFIQNMLAANVQSAESSLIGY